MTAADIGPGRAHPIGARVGDGGVNFSVFAEHASAVELLLFLPGRGPRSAVSGGIYRADMRSAAILVKGSAAPS
jgi:pullulanase/glycogen debranching enzyme